MIGEELFKNEQSCLDCVPGKPQLVIGSNRSYQFDYVFDQECSQVRTLYKYLVLSMIKIKIIKFVDFFNFKLTGSIVKFVKYIIITKGSFYFNFHQEEVYDESVAPLIGTFFDGFNATVFAYGQTVRYYSLTILYWQCQFRFRTFKSLYNYYYYKRN